MQKKSERGFASVLIVLALAALSAWGLECYYKADMENQIVQRRVQGIQALYAAEAGIEWAKAALRANPGWRQGERTLSQGSVSVSVSVSVSADKGGYTVVATGKARLGVRKICVFMVWQEEDWVLCSYQEMHN
ncbi:MAG: hypothetical protein LBT32_09875 [Peptococcaceae bacterium]|nr:hypothetical protein [Peptococcaceae bacterium]